MTTSPHAVPSSRARFPALAGGLVGALALVEFTSGILQGYYLPLFTDIARFLDINDADINWFEAAQLLLSAVAVPVLARLGDMVGHKRMLLLAIALTAAATWGVAFAPTFWVFLVAWALQGFYVVWLPLNVAIIYSRSRSRSDGPALTRKATGLIVVALQAGAISGALLGGAVGTALAGSLWLVMAVPAVLVTVCVILVAWKVPDDSERYGGTVDVTGVALLSLGLITITSGLSLVRVNGLASWWPWLLVAAGIGVIAAFLRVERDKEFPLVDVHVFRRPSMWPIQLTAALFGVSVLGAQGPLSTFARTDPERYGYGLGMTTATVSFLIGPYVFALLVGAGLFAKVSTLTTPRRTLIGAASLVSGGYLALVPFHDTHRERPRLHDRGWAGLGRAGGGAACGCGRGRSARPDGDGHGVDEHHQDDRRSHRVHDVRARALLGRDG